MSGWTVRSTSPQSIVRPAERSEANGTTSSAGKPRSRITPSIVEPTAPVAPTTATLMRLVLGTTGRWSPDTSSRRTASAPSSNAVCSSRTAVSTSSSRITHEILIGEVEIISMFTPASPSTVKVLAATPGWLFIPAPTSDTFPMCSSVAIPPMPSSS